MIKDKEICIAIFGVGYVGLPLAIEFGKYFDVIGYDLNRKRINELNKHIDSNQDLDKKKFSLSKNLKFSSRIKDLKKCNIYIITVPTPINKSKTPDLKNVINACKHISKLIDINNIVILESTVYPGVTEEICVPILEKGSKLIYNKEFFVGYSPERINPNDKKHTIKNIIKITSGSNLKTANFIDNMYKKIVKIGTHKAKSIKVAEAAKVIENSQRDLNIAFVNELCLIFDKLGINTNEVLKAASTKWNFINFQPGLVGGHCIGVDPYYLTYKSKKKGYSPKIITAGREINDKFVDYIVNKSLKNTKKFFKTKKIKFLILGLTFKENCVDYRNSKSIELVEKLRSKKIKTDCYDPLINIEEFSKNHKIKVLKKINLNYYHCCIIAVGHNYFKNLGESKIRSFLVKKGLIFDIKNIFPNNKNNIYL